MFKTQCTFHIAGTRFSLTAEVRPMRAAKDLASEKGMRTIDLQTVPADSLELTISGSASSGSGGQISEDLRAAAEECGISDVIELCSIWDRWHLNGLKAGTRAQMTYLETVPTTGRTFEGVKAALLEAGLQPDTNTLPGSPYSYGSAWLYEPLPVDVATRLETLCTALDGQRFGSIDIDDLPEIDDGADTLNSSDIIARLDGLAAWLAEQGVDMSADDIDSDEFSDDVCTIFEEWHALREFADQGESYASDWNYGETLIADSYFEEHAQETAESCGMVKQDATWPNNHIDWTAAANELKGDYTAIEFKGTTFWIR